MLDKDALQAANDARFKYYAEADPDMTPSEMHRRAFEAALEAGIDAALAKVDKPRVRVETMDTDTGTMTLKPGQTAIVKQAFRVTYEK